jgi:type IV secretion system protein VirB6
MNGCAVSTDLGLVRDVLSAVDCNTRGFASAGYESLTLAGSPFQTALTLLLTIYVAVMGYRLFFATGGASLSDGPGAILKIGAILTLVTNWSVFQTLVFDMASRAPVEIARIITVPLRDGAALADPIAALQAAYDQLSAAAEAFAKVKTSGAAGAAQTLELAANILFVASAGLIALLTVAIGVLTAIGPVFVALFLFVQTRGFFAGWVRALAAAAFGLFGGWTLTVLTLHALAPWLSALSKSGPLGAADVQIGITTAVIVFVFAASQAGLLLAGFIIARGFRLAPQQGRLANPRPARETVSMGSMLPVSRPSRLAEQLQFRTEIYETPGRNGVLAAALSRGPRLEAPPAPRLGDLYRRPAISRHEPRREA